MFVFFATISGAYLRIVIPFMKHVLIRVDSSPITGLAAGSNLFPMLIIHDRGSSRERGRKLADISNIIGVDDAAEFLTLANFYCFLIMFCYFVSQGGSQAALQHWESRVMADDVMVASLALNRTDRYVLSPITLAVLQDSGWWVELLFLGLNESADTRDMVKYVLEKYVLHAGTPSRR